MTIPPLPSFINLKDVQYPPIDLWNTIGPPSLPTGLLPKIIEDYAMELSVHMGADASGLAMAALAAASAAIPDSIKLQVKAHDTRWLESARIWTLLIGPPSSKKSPIISSAIRPIAQIDTGWVRQWRQDYARWSALPKDEKAQVPEPLQRRLRIEDTTIEAAQEVFKGSHQGVLCVQDEASGWFGAMEKYNSAKGASADRAFWLRSYNGGEYCLNRVGRGFTLIENLSMSFLGGIQPEPLRAIASNSADDGLMQRMLPVMLMPAKVGLDSPRPDVQSIYDFTIFMLTHLNIKEPLRFDYKAQNLRMQVEERHHFLAQAEMINPKFGSHIQKFDGLFARLCIIWHALENGINLPPVISFETAERVSHFMERFIIPHVACFYSSLGLSDEHDRVKAVAEHILAHELTRVSVRDVQRGTRAMRKIGAPDVLPVLQQLVALCWVMETPGPRKNSDPEFLVNPFAHHIYKERAAIEKMRIANARSVMDQYFRK